MYVEVLTQISAKAVDQYYVYSVPEVFRNNIKIGIRVRIPFGKMELEGFVMNILNDTDYDKSKIRDISDVVDDRPVLNKEMILLGKYMSKHLLCSLVSAYQVMLPKALKAKVNTNIKIKYNKYLRRTKSIEEIDKYDSDEENENTEITGDIQEINEFKLIDKLTIESIDSQNDNNLFISNDSTFSSNNLQMIKYKNGFIYVGLTNNDVAKGIGKLYHHYSIVYKGYFELNQFCDYGIYYNEDINNTYEGEWNYNQKNGIGIDKYLTNSEYKGEFQKGNKEGIGSLFWSNGDKYEGEWKHNEMNGIGIYSYSNGSQYRGEFKNNMMDGYGEFDWFDDKLYIGSYKNDRRFGYGIFFFNKKVYIGTWLNGKMHGFGKLLHKNKKTIYGYWDSGNLVLNYNTLDSVIKENEFLKKQKTLLNLVSIDDITIYNLYKLKNKSV